MSSDGDNIRRLWALAWAQSIFSLYYAQLNSPLTHLKNNNKIGQPLIFSHACTIFFKYLAK